MLQWFRAQARAISSVALVALATITVLSAAPHDEDCDDTPCTATGRHDPGDHTIAGATSTSDRPLHCVLCHCTRTVRPSAGAFQPLAPFVEVTCRRAEDTSGARQPSLARQPLLRGPPTTPRTA
jgi:hypothetical protein